MRTPIASDLAEPILSPADRVAATTYRILRDTELARSIKRLYNFECQLCGSTIELPDGARYAEAHHIRPLGRPHDGPDVRENILVLCPNHHAMCDLGGITLTSQAIRTNTGHVISEQHLRYHNERLVIPVHGNSATAALVLNRTSLKGEDAK